MIVRMDSRHRRRCFTLAELLVMIAITASLVSILLPVLLRARDKASAATCAGNMRKIGIAVYIYVDENADFLPYSDYVGAYSESNPAPQELLHVYYRNARAFVCPTDATPENYNWWRFGGHASFRSGSSYMFSEQAIRHSNPVASMKRPTRFGFMSEGYVCSNGSTWNTLNQFNGLTGWGIRVDWDHMLQVNVLWGDGHVKAVHQRSAAVKVRSDPKN